MGWPHACFPVAPALFAAAVGGFDGDAGLGAGAVGVVLPGNVFNGAGRSGRVRGGQVGEENKAVLGALRDSGSDSDLMTLARASMKNGALLVMNNGRASSVL